MNIIELTLQLLIIDRGGSWELAGGFVGCPIDGRPKPLIGLELLLDIKSFIDPSQHALLKRLKDHIDINYVVQTDMVKSKKGEKETEVCTNKFFTVMKNLVVQTLDLMLLKFLSNALQLIDR